MTQQTGLTTHAPARFAPRFVQASRRLLMYTVALNVLPAAAFALPPLPTIVTNTTPVAPGPAADVSVVGTTMTVDQNAARVFYDFDSFNVANGETVNFIMDAADWIALARINSASGISNIDGIINTLNNNFLPSGGHVWLINSAGIAFGPNARVNVGGLLASTAAPAPADFIGSNLETAGVGLAFSGPGGGTVSVANGAQIVGNGGVLAFIAPTVNIAGAVTANSPGDDAGHVLYAASDNIRLTFATDPTSPGGWDLFYYTVATGDPTVTGGITHAATAATTAGAAFFYTPGQAATIGSMNLAGVIDANSAVATDSGVVLTSSSNGSNIGQQLNGFGSSGPETADLNAANLTVTTNGSFRANADAITLGDVDAALGIDVDGRRITTTGSLTAGQGLILETRRLSPTDLSTGVDITLGGTISGALVVVQSGVGSIDVQAGATISSSATNSVELRARGSITADATSLLSAANVIVEAGLDQTSLGVTDFTPIGGSAITGLIEAGDVSITARDGSVGVTGDITATNNVVIQSIPLSLTTTGDPIGGVSITANITANGSITASSFMGDLLLGSPFGNVPATIRADADGNGVGSVLLQSRNSMDLDTGGSLIAAGPAPTDPALPQPSGTGDITIESGVVYGALDPVVSDTDLNVTNLNGRNITINARSGTGPIASGNGHANLAGATVNATGNLTVTGGWQADISSVVTVGGDATITGGLGPGGAGVVIGGAFTQTGGGTTTLTANAGDIAIGANMTSDGAITAATNDAILFNANMAATSVSLTAPVINIPVGFTVDGRSTLFLGGVGGGDLSLTGGGLATSDSGSVLITGDEVLVDADVSGLEEVTTLFASGFTLATNREMAAPRLVVEQVNDAAGVNTATIATGAVLGQAGATIYLQAEDVVLDGQLTGEAVQIEAEVTQLVPGGGMTARGLQLGGAGTSASTNANFLTLTQVEFDRIIADTLLLTTANAASNPTLPPVTEDIFIGDLALDGARLGRVVFGTGGDSRIDITGAITHTGVSPALLAFGVSPTLFAELSNTPGLFANDIDTLIPAEIRVMGAVGTAAAPVDRAAFTANGNVMIGSSAFMDAVFQNPQLDPATLANTFGGVTPGQVFVAADALNISAGGLVISQNTGDAVNGAGIIFGNDAADPLILEGPLGDPTRVALFGSLNRGGVISGPDVATAPGLLGPGVPTASSTYLFNTCAIPTGCAAPPPPAPPPPPPPPPPAPPPPPPTPPTSDTLSTAGETAAGGGGGVVLAVVAEEEEGGEGGEAGSRDPVTGSGAIERWRVPASLSSEGGE